jgi:3-methylcrotonyl-CoA carboxylase alpha subunit
MAALYLVLSLAERAKQQAAKTNDPHSPWNNTNAWRLNEAHVHHLVLSHNDIEYIVRVEQKRSGSSSYYLITVNGEGIDEKAVDCQGSIDGELLKVSIDGHRSSATIAHFENSISLYSTRDGQKGVFNFTHIQPDCGNSHDDESHGGLVAPMNGTMVSVLVETGDTVEKDQPLVIMEAMKMEHTIRAPSKGTVDAIYFSAGEMVDGGAELLAFSSSEEQEEKQ